MDDPLTIAQLEKLAAEIDQIKAGAQKQIAEAGKVEAETIKTLAEAENIDADTDHNITIPSITGQMPSLPARRLNGDRPPPA
jgi:hypothetical protein